MKFSEYSCFKPPLHDLNQSQSQYSWNPLFGESLQPSRRSNHAVCVVDNKVFMYGGRGTSGTLNQFWMLNCDSLEWTDIPAQKNSPPRLEGHSMVVYDGKIYIFGGETSFASADESPLWCYDIDEDSWSKIWSRGEVMEPVGRRQHTAVLYMDVMCVYGGYQDLIGPIKEMWLFDLETKTWHFDVAASNESAPDGRYGHCAAVHGQSMWVCGGLTGLKPISDVLVWNFEVMKWITVKTKGGPAELSGHSMLLANGSMYVFGGSNTVGKTAGEMWMLSLSDTAWKKCPTKDLKPPAIAGHTMLLLQSPKLFKRGYRTRSFPDMKNRTAARKSVEKERSVSCGKLPNDSKFIHNPDEALNNTSTSLDDAVTTHPSGGSEFAHAYDNPLMFAEKSTHQPMCRPSRIPVRTQNGPRKVQSKGDYVTSRMKYGNITNGSSLKIFSYNLIDDSLQDDVTSLKLSETSFIDISNSPSSHLCVTDVTTGEPELPKKNGYPLITVVKPLHTTETTNHVEVELESMDIRSTKPDDVECVVASSFESDSGANSVPHSENFPSRLRKRLVCEYDEQFMMLVIGGEPSSNGASSKQFMMWQCMVTPYS